MAGLMKAGVCFFCHDGKGKYLIGKRASTLTREPGTWSPGAGGVEFGESVEDALRRELREEYDTKPISFDFMGFRHFINSENDHLIMFDYRVLVNPEEVKNNEPDRCEGLRWITLTDLDSITEPFHPQMTVFLEKNRTWLT